MLFSLPEEILVCVLGELNFKDVITCQSVCRSLNSTINGSLLLRYRLTLASYGLCDNELSGRSVGDKLRRAQLYHHTLRNIQWTPHITIKFEGLSLIHPSSPIILRDPAAPGNLTIILSGSSLRDVLERHWVISPPPTSVFTYAFNVAEDLAILQTSDVPRSRHHFLSLSSGMQHPEAGRAFLEGETIALDSTTFGPYLFIHGLGDVHTLWNWKTGNKLTDICCHYYAVAFIDQDHIALVSMTRAVGLALHVYNLPFTIYNPNTARMKPAHYVFGLPTLRSRPNENDPRLCSLKRGLSMPPTSAVAALGDFFTNPDDVLLTVELAQITPQRQYEIFIPLRALQALLTPEHRGRLTPWASWGPQRTHATPLLRYPPIVGWRSFSTFGMRRIGLYPTQRTDGVMVAKLFDYHPHRVALARVEKRAGDQSMVVVDGETVYGDWVESDGLETHLSHIEIEVPLPEELQLPPGCMVTLGINDDGIIACTDFVASRPTVAHVYSF